MAVSVLPEKLLLSGVEIESPQSMGSVSGAESFVTVIYPWDGSTEVGRANLLGIEQLGLVHQRIEQGSQRFAQTTRAQRLQILESLIRRLDESKEQLARLITLETGKPIRYARMEVRYGLSVLKAYRQVDVWEKHERLVLPDALSADVAQTQSVEVLTWPIGGILAVLPYSFSLGLAIEQLAPALVSGCSLALKPSSKAPLSAMLLGRLAVQAGYSAMSVLPCQPYVAEQLMQLSCFKRRFFAGSLAVARHLQAQGHAVGLMQRQSSFQLAGYGVCLVDDFPTPPDPYSAYDFSSEYSVSDLLDESESYTGEGTLTAEQIVQMIAQSAFGFSGQMAGATQRILVNHQCYDAFLKAFLEQARQMKVGDPMKDDTDMGPMATTDAVFYTRNLIKETIRAGANVLYGGNTFNTYTMNPTVFNRTTPEMTLNHQFVPAPIVTIAPYESLDDVVAGLQSQTHFLQQVSLYCNDSVAINQMKQTLNVPTLHVNQTRPFLSDVLLPVQVAERMAAYSHSRLVM